MAVAPAVLCVVMALAAVFQGADARSRDEQSIRDLVARYESARNARDTAAIGALFTADADQLVSAVAQAEQAFGTVTILVNNAGGNPGDRTLAVETIRFPSRDTALADARYEIAGGAGVPPRRMWSTFVAVRTPEGWRLAAIRNMLPAR
jgi:uncharacterized protein (TIGR02246 family)